MAKITTITNPLTGQPAQVDQLDHTAQQIDDGLNIARGVSNPNLLDNWYFGNPVDQRGGYVVPPGVDYRNWGAATVAGTTTNYVTVYGRDNDGNGFITINGANYWVPSADLVRGYAAGMGVPTYTVDRWNIEAFCSAVIESDGLIANFYNAGYNLSQLVDASVFNAIKGRTVTLSAIVDGVLSSAMVVMPNATPAERTELLLEYRGNLRFRIVLNPTGVIEVIFSSIGVQTNKFKAIKLELGSQQTLAHQDANGNWVLNEIPDYGEQLRRCQRYYYRLSATNTSKWARFGNGMVDSSARAEIYLFIPPMRDAPSASLHGTFSITIGSSNKSVDGSELSIVDDNTTNSVVVARMSGSYTSGLPTTIQAHGDANAYIEFTADL